MSAIFQRVVRRTSPSQFGAARRRQFREAFERAFRRTRARPSDASALVTWLETALGPMLAGATPDGVCLLEFTDSGSDRARCAAVHERFGSRVVAGEDEHLFALRRELTEYFEGERREFTFPLVFPGTPFQEQVWRQLLAIPYGETRSYKEVARAIGNDGASRAVGHANGENRIAIVIPCHRVINAGGQLGGYGGGFWRKRFLLELETAAEMRPCPL